jgi:hypothetical protein
MKINDNTKLKVRIPKNLYESVKKELAKKKIQEQDTMGLAEDGLEEGAEDLAWIPAAAAGLGIAAVALKGIIAIMKEKGYKGLGGLLKAWKEFKAGQGDVASKF